MANGKPSAHMEKHLFERARWIRASVLGASDGIVSVASIMVGVAAATSDVKSVLIAGVAGICAGALSMAAGEYVSVSSQADVERADLAKEKEELEKSPEMELKELTDIYVWRGLSKKLARQVAVELTAHNALEAHARDELGISDFTTAKPFQAAFASAISFAFGAIIPLSMIFFIPPSRLMVAVIISALFANALLGFVGAWLGGAKAGRAILRVVFWGALAMAVTIGVGLLFHINP
ncbi:MAG: VIT family protein [Alphaproteobacteria bacterium]|nr:VIT family protein [Alphaproteobacteria bacterium]